MLVLKMYSNSTQDKGSCYPESNSWLAVCMDKERDQWRLEPAEGLRTGVGFNLWPSC